MKITKELKERIKELRNNDLTYSEIRDKIKEEFNLELSLSSIVYHSNEKAKTKAIERAKEYSKKYWKEGNIDKEKRRIYIREYMRKRYHSDKEFREMHLKNCLDYQRRKREEKING